MYNLCRKLRDMTPYEPITGHYEVRLDANESFAALPEASRAKMRAALDTVALNRYPDPRAAGVCAAFARLHGVDPALVTAGNGSDELISIITACFLEAGETVLTAAPDFSMYAFYSDLYEKRVVTVQKGDGFRLDPDALLAAAREADARAVLFSNPCNPTGQGLTRAEVRRIVTGTDALVVLDEAYMDFWDEPLLPEVAAYDNLIVLKTCSKALGAAGLRLGFAVANERLTRALQAAKSPYNIGSVTQALGETLLAETDYLRAKTAEIVAQKDALFAALSAFNAVHSAGWVVWPTVTNFTLVATPDARRLHKALLAESVAVRAFDGFLRITAPAPDELPKLMAALDKAVSL